MKDVVILQAFTGYPNGVERLFTPSSDPISVSNEFAENIVGKSLAELYEPAPKAKPAKPKPTKDPDTPAADDLSAADPVPPAVTPAADETPAPIAPVTDGDVK